MTGSKVAAKTGPIEVGQNWETNEPIMVSPCCKEGDSTMTEHRLYTACWKVALQAASDEVVLVRTSIGGPRWAPKGSVSQLESIKELMPYGLMAKDLPWPCFVKGYTERLEATGVTVFEEIFEEIRGRQGERPLVLLCFEHDPRECHRGVFANWWMEQTGEVIPEWPSGDCSHVTDEPQPEPAQSSLI